MIDLSSVAVVIGPDGKPTAVQMDIATWQAIVAALEDADDVALAQQMLADLDAVHPPPRNNAHAFVGRVSHTRRGSHSNDGGRCANAPVD